MCLFTSLLIEWVIDPWPANTSLVLEAITRRGEAWCSTVEYFKAWNVKTWIIHLWHFNECKKSLPIIHNLHSCCNVTLAAVGTHWGFQQVMCSVYVHVEEELKQMSSACTVSCNRDHVVTEIFILPSKIWAIYIYTIYMQYTIYIEKQEIFWELRNRNSCVSR